MGIGGAVHEPMPDWGKMPDGEFDRELTAKAWLKARDARNEAFPTGLFTEPGWDILLDLYVAHCRGERLPVSSIAAAKIPPTTVLRWIVLLEDLGYVDRIDDPRDQRRKLLGLLPEGAARVEKALDGAVRSDRKLGLGRLRLVD